MMRFVDATGRMTRTHRTSRRLAFHYSFILTQPIWQILGMHRPGRCTCSLGANPSMSGLSPPPMPVIILHTCQRFLIFRARKLYTNVFNSYPIPFKTSTRNNTRQVQQLPLSRIANGNSFIWFSPLSSMKDSSMRIDMGLCLNAEMAIAADCSLAS